MLRPLIQVNNEVREMTDAEYAEWQSGQSDRNDSQEKVIRAERDRILADSDWRVIKAFESNMPQEFVWAEYRQALRDVTRQEGFPWSIIWPIAPK